MAALATVADVEAVAGVTVDDDDIERVERLLELASDRVREYTAQTISAVAADSVTFDAPFNSDIWLPERPVTALTSVTVDGVLVASTGYSWNASGRIRRNWFYPWATYGPLGTTIVVVYSHGWATIPSVIVEVVAELVATRYTVQADARPVGVKALAIDGYSVTFDGDVGASMQLTDEHEARLKRYRIPVTSSEIGISLP